MTDSAAYERLGSQDAIFVMFEDRGTPMHISAIGILEPGPLRTESDGLDAERVLKYVESRLHRLPHYRQKLGSTPLAHHPIWVDDTNFDLSYHVRHASVPRPGDDRALKRLIGRILSQPLDRDRPLWELWLVEGLESGYFAVLCKVHHCMADGVAGVGLMNLLFSPRPDDAFGPPPAWRPRPAPTTARLLLDEARRRSDLPTTLLRESRGALTHPQAAASTALEATGALFEAAREGLHWPPSTAHNGPIGSQRRVEWQSFALDRVKRVKQRLGGTVNDVVLAVTAGALRGFLNLRGADLDARRAGQYRIVVPVNIRAGNAGSSGNQVSAYLPELPIAESNPLERYARIREELSRVKAARSAQGMALFLQLADTAGSTLATRAGVALATRLHPFNLVVTNVPGPQFPLHLLGARLLKIVPQVPLFAQQGLGVAVMSYDGNICFGLVGDYDLVPDLHCLRDEFAASFEELEKTSAEL